VQRVAPIIRFAIPPELDCRDASDAARSFHKCILGLVFKRQLELRTETTSMVSDNHKKRLRYAPVVWAQDDGASYGIARNRNVLERVGSGDACPSTNIALRKPTDGINRVESKPWDVMFGLWDMVKLVGGVPFMCDCGWRSPSRRSHDKSDQEYRRQGSIDQGRAVLPKVALFTFVFPRRIHELRPRLEDSHLQFYGFPRTPVSPPLTSDDRLSVS
jgi:hypothetical protein